LKFIKRDLFVRLKFPIFNLDLFSSFFSWSNNFLKLYQKKDKKQNYLKQGRDRIFNKIDFGNYEIRFL